jgi:hypothetical protein
VNSFPLLVEMLHHIKGGSGRDVRPLNLETMGQPQPQTIKLKLRDIDQLFNSMDPSPLIEKDLDEKAEEFIVGWALEFTRETPLKLRVELEQRPGEDVANVIQQAVHNYFAHRAELAELEFRNLMRQGRMSLLIGLSCLATCLIISQTLLPARAGTWASVMRESLTIAGWVAMWRPMQIYLYDWWPLRRRGRIFAKLSVMPVEVVSQRKI